MSTSPDRFKQSIVITLAKRAANRCSNPDCGAVTSGPSGDSADSVNVGEAAHIFGANPGSARYDSEMASAERANITNAIWLCANCHKLVDDDPTRYPAGLLFEWQREHERVVAAVVGKAGAELRQRYENRHLEEFGRLSYLSERILTERGDHWEYRLTAEVLRFEMAPVLQRWRALKRGLYAKPNEYIDRAGFFVWTQRRLAEITQITRALDVLMNEEFKIAWGEPGIAGDDKAIVATCRLFSEMCQSALLWEEAVRFAKFDKRFEEVAALYVGIAGDMIDEVAKLPPFVSEIFASPNPSGRYQFSITLTLPEGWNDQVEQALERALASLNSEGD